jgi:hypothetical protein
MHLSSHNAGCPATRKLTARQYQEFFSRGVKRNLSAVANHYGLARQFSAHHPSSHPKAGAHAMFAVERTAINT